MFVRGGNLWAATAPALPPEPTPLDDAGKVVNNFMQARLNGLSDQAGTYLDASGKAAYTSGGLNLKGGAQYTLVVQTSLRDVLGQNVAAEYDLTFLGPAGKKHPTHRDAPGSGPSTSPSPAGSD